MRTTDEIIHNGQTLTEILRLHKCWRIGKDEGERANLRGSNLSGTNYNENTAFFALQCPEDGAFIAWKKLQKGLIAKLMIPEDAKRSSATTRKCRSSKAIVISIFDCDGKEVDKGFSSRNSSFVYEKGKEVLPHDFDDDRWKECSGGIHFFITKQEAINYN